jgi:hypothetical protein
MLRIPAAILALTILGGLAASAGADPGDRVEIPFDSEDHRIYVPVKVNGQGPFRFMLDTGADGIGRIDARLREQLGLTPFSQGENSDGVNVSAIDLLRVDRLELAGIARKKVVLPTRSYNRADRDPQQWIEGIIGAGFFEGYLLTIDYPGGKILFEKRRLDPGDPHVTPYDLPFHIPVALGDAATFCWLDTGSALSMHLPRAVGEPLMDGPLEAAGSGGRANTSFDLLRGTLRVPVRIAGNEIRRLRVIVSDKAEEINIGGALLGGYVVSLDQKSRLVRIAPPGSLP